MMIPARKHPDKGISTTKGFYEKTDVKCLAGSAAHFREPLGVSKCTTCGRKTQSVPTDPTTSLHQMEFLLLYVMQLLHVARIILQVDRIDIWGHFPRRQGSCSSPGYTIARFEWLRPWPDMFEKSNFGLHDIDTYRYYSGLVVPPTSIGKAPPRYRIRFGS